MSIFTGEGVSTGGCSTTSCYQHSGETPVTRPTLTPTFFPSRGTTSSWYYVRKKHTILPSQVFLSSNRIIL